MNLKELSLFLTEEIFVIKDEIKEKLAAQKMASRLDLNSSASSDEAAETEIANEPIAADPEPIPYEGEYKKSILVIYQGMELNENNRAFLFKIFNAVNLSLKDIALVSEQSLKGSNQDAIEQLNPDKLIVFGTIYHPVMRLKKETYHIVQGTFDYFFADELDGLEKNIALKRKLWNTLQIFFNIKQK